MSAVRLGDGRGTSEEPNATVSAVRLGDGRGTSEEPNATVTHGRVRFERMTL